MDNAQVIVGTQASAKHASRPMMRPVNPMKVADALVAFAAPVPGFKVQIVKPFACFSANAYSTATTLPLGPAYLASVLETAGYAVDLVDGLGEGILNITRSPCGQFNYQGLTVDEIIGRLAPDVRVIGVSVMWSQNWVQNRELINAIRQARPDAIIVVGGEHVTALPELTLRDCPAIDVAVTGEGELTLLELVHRIANDRSHEDMDGLCFIRDGQFVNNGFGKRVADFENLPRPAWHLCPVENYFSGMWSMGIGYGRNMIVLATRGCPYQCTFCSNPVMWTTRYLMRPPAHVVDEIEWLVNSYGANSIDFADLTAIVKKEWVIEFCAELKRRNLHINWQLPSGTRSEALDAETVQIIHDAGCKFLVYAPESGSQDTLDRIKKKIKLPTITRSMAAAVSAGHTTKACMIIGFPHERRKHVFQSMLFAAKLGIIGVDDCNISPFTPYPGSELFNELRAEGRIPELDDTYFNSLVTQFDFVTGVAYCRNIPGWEIAIYRFLGMVIFYSLSYLCYPKRIWRVIRGITKNNFSPRSLAEQRVCDYLGRRKLGNKGK
ncbi:B12-binding domain-containing radical SAM protein [Magnetospirillum gryphiswaldense]|uniref:B12-binding:Radical SAM n=1 Tax=Magnetospirillum gryphiswaldense TaxID=55518 RepID=A4U2W1_9PROT|nr:radical SAM protein [Magnetospirillum gryphiswaldense]AVM75632.1 B12 binding domain protein [Magnetospirillum gryphiswaldense MSR-1]AVM79535.1 B12 binding domain protein [Magnetospirillum gryphiswaldense]CAM77218.1 B12-binding:Radical SAM [Magnetospirillum gryphiswaldense MSR-1]